MKAYSQTLRVTANVPATAAVGNSSAAYTLYSKGKTCGIEASKLGKLASPAVCAAAVLAHPECGRHFMFSVAYPNWDCRCCGKDNMDGGDSNANWDLYRAGPAEAPDGRVLGGRGKPQVGLLQEPPQEPRLFPLVQKMDMDGGCCTHLDKNVQVRLEGSAAQASPLLLRAAARVQAALQRLAPAAAVGVALVLVRVVLTAVANETLDEDTSWAYNLACEAAGCRLEAEGVFGAVGALQSTLLQLFAHGGRAHWLRLRIQDWPAYRLRGLMLDAGRRFVPKAVLLNQVLDGMALVRMNHLQLHLNDFCRFALALPSFPELNRGGLHEGQYSAADAREIVDYARDRGIRIVPEVDLPGHADGLLPLKPRGLRFCEAKAGKTRPEHAAKVFDDPAGSSRAVLRQVLAETAEAFGPDVRWLHVGGDEASPTGECTRANIAAIEGFAVREVLGLGLTPVAWEELRLKEPEEDGVLASGHSNATVVVVWQKGTPRGLARRGHRVVSAELKHHYLDYSYRQHPVENFWYDPGAKRGSDAGTCTRPSWEPAPGKFLGGMPEPKGKSTSLAEAQARCVQLGFRCAGVTCKRGGGNSCTPREGEPFLGATSAEDSWTKNCPQEPDLPELPKLHLGGMSTMWTDKYAYVYQCGAAHASWGAKTGTLPTADVMFLRELDTSFGRSLAGMIWPRAAVSAAALWRYVPGANVSELSAWIAAVLTAVAGVDSCPPGCECDELMQCTSPYPVLRGSDSSGSEAECFHQDEAGELGSAIAGEPQLPWSDAARLCFWRGMHCGGLRCGTEGLCTLHASGGGGGGTGNVWLKRSGRACTPYGDCLEDRYWQRQPGKFMSGYAGEAHLGAMADVKVECVAMGSKCKGITCEKQRCTARAGDLRNSPVGEESYVKLPCP